jgi:two-component system response regulator GlrR
MVAGTCHPQRLFGEATAEAFSKLNLIGQSPQFLAVLRRIERMAVSDATVLIQGETGTGKELAARAIHYLGPRRDGPFIPLNCGAIPDNLFENELFGHNRGAFTDAREAATGLLAEAEGGTLFLDEIEALSARGQVVLLRVLQDHRYRSLGGKKLLDANVRVVAASNANLRRMVETNDFRADLLYRIALMPVDLPPLRDRGDDIELLSRHFFCLFRARYKLDLQLSPRSLDVLKAHPWPGNVRELENLIHREILLCEDGTLDLGGALAPPSSAGKDQSPVHPHAAFECGFSAAKNRLIQDFERNFVIWALEQSGGNVTAAARKAGKERRSFGRLVKKYGIHRLLGASNQGVL